MKREKNPDESSKREKEIQKMRFIYDKRLFLVSLDQPFTNLHAIQILFQRNTVPTRGMLPAVTGQSKQETHSFSGMAFQAPNSTLESVLSVDKFVFSSVFCFLTPSYTAFLPL